MKDFEKSVLDTVRQHHMISPGQHVVIGLSGGADSTCLLMVLCALREELVCTLSAVHVHHGLRESADRDAAFCTALCERCGVSLTVVHADAAAYATTHGESIEEAGRSIRYRAFREAIAVAAADADCMKRQSDQEQRMDGCIATAHHREDLAETVLFNLCRGSGIAGLAGIQPVMGDVIRPLLYASRQEIEEYLTLRGISWCEDETNRDTEITRNYLRLETLPGLTGHVNAGTIDHLVRFSREAIETEQYLAEQTEAAWERLQAADGISLDGFRKEPAILQRRILRYMILRAAGRSKDITAGHVAAVLRICADHDGTASVNLPYGLTATRCYDHLTICAGDAAAIRQAEEMTGTYRMHVFCRGGREAAIPCEQYTKWFDYDRIGAFPILRTRRSGDVITIGSGIVKSLRRFMIDEKIPRDLRDQIEIPFVGEQALWIPGHQINAAFKISDETNRILEIVWEP